MVGPSPLPFHADDPIPKAMSETDIEYCVEAWETGARRALDAGFKVIELHAAHGYLMHEFLSPLSNHRTDNYGGSLANRMRLLLMVAKRLRNVIPSELPLFVRISATDWVENGWTEQDSVKLASILKTKGVDLIDCSTGGNVTGVRIPLKPMYQSGFAETIKKETGILTGAVGLITTAEEAESLIAEGKADAVFMARELLRDPYFAHRAADELKSGAQWPVQYERAKRK